MKTRNRLGLGLFYVIHPCRSRTFLQPRSQSGQLLGRSDRQHFNAAIGIVAHPSGNTENVCFALHEPAKTDALDTSAHEKAKSLDARLIAGESHRSFD